MKTLGIFCIISLLLTGCSRQSINYYQPEYAMADRFTSSCNGKGPNDHIRIPLHQHAYVEVTAYFSQVTEGNFIANISYFVPEEHTLKFVDRTVLLLGANNLNKRFEVNQVFRFMGTKQVERQSIEGLLPGRTIPIKYFQEIRDVDLGYRINISKQFATNSSEFTLQIPVVEVNGQVVETDPIPFRLAEMKKTLPANCQLPQYQN
ncbi:hypothetical protein [Thalassotalea mangrovi]|uniref:Lipoprotein n=1 Tax=Thalassotalea mangrovi TaxID=2572245 RepID=A0A4V5NU65_9GAMM|nr:hypothetical protein [Thalassotalea mangrovi]TKB44872.1 hypothetical protein E8M12_10215 [Thalassotalea mangrovi]